MPSKTKKQAALMRMACAGKSKKVPRKVGCKYVRADRAKAKRKRK